MKVSSPTPVCLFAYNRPHHLKKTVQALAANELADQTQLIVYSDAPKEAEAAAAVAETRSFLDTVSGFREVTIIERETNLGLAASIIDGVTRTISEFGRAIVLEDDLVTSPFFLRYMNDGLELYADNEAVASIHGYVYPVKGLPDFFFLRGADCWGWATWARAWRHFQPDGQNLLDRIQNSPFRDLADFGGFAGNLQMLRAQIAGKNNSWAIRWYFSALLNDQFTLYPGNTFVQNIGVDGSGTHFRSSSRANAFRGNLIEDYRSLDRIAIVDCGEARAAFGAYFRNRFIAEKVKAIISRIRYVFRGQF